MEFSPKIRNITISRIQEVPLSFRLNKKTAGWSAVISIEVYFFGARGETRTHTPLQVSVFETDSSASSDTRAQFPVNPIPSLAFTLYL